MDFLGGSDGKASTTMQESHVQSLDGEDLPRKEEWLHSPVFLLGALDGQRSLAGYSPWGHKESGTTEQLIHTHPLVMVVVSFENIPFTCEHFEFFCCD